VSQKQQYLSISLDKIYLSISFDTVSFNGATWWMEIESERKLRLKVGEIGASI